MLQDENGAYYGFHVSHFRAANIRDERRYFIPVSDGNMMPAVKRGDMYLNLVSWQEVPCSADFDNVLESDETHFAPKAGFPLSCLYLRAPKILGGARRFASSVRKILEIFSNPLTES